MPARDRSRDRKTPGSSRRVSGARGLVRRGSRTPSRGSGSGGPMAAEPERARVGEPFWRAPRRMA
eukprot:11124227-Lingulodinium_polyedra.AAC.1